MSRLMSQRQSSCVRLWHSLVLRHSSKRARATVVLFVLIAVLGSLVDNLIIHQQQHQHTTRSGNVEFSSLNASLNNKHDDGNKRSRFPPKHDIWRAGDAHAAAAVATASSSPLLLSCVPRYPNMTESRTVLIVFAAERMGSNLFLDLIDKLVVVPNKNRNKAANNKVTQDEDLLIPVKAIYEDKSNKMPTVHVFRVVRAMVSSCQGMESLQESLLGIWRKERDIRQNPEQALAFLQEHAKTIPALAKWLELHHHRRERPAEVIQFLSRIPSRASNPIVPLKIFEGQLLQSVHDFLVKVAAAATASSHHHDNPPPHHHPIIKFAILWRRRLIESYVSFQIAARTRDWTQADTGEEVIQANQTQLERYIQKRRAFFASIRDELRNLNVPFDVFEYGRDLLDEDRQQRTIQRLRRILNLTPSLAGTESSNPQSYHNSNNNSTITKLRKQSTVPLSKQVSNWEDVVRWGYGGESNDWQDLFGQEEV